eukprot:scaffold4918_cov46-Cyclotella_meneghiniana.AAC.9
MASNASGQCTEFANKIKIQSTTGEPLSLREVRVYSGEVNVAIGGNATQSSDLNDDSGASKAVDNKWRSKATTSDDDCAPWWQVDLGNSTAINKVVLVNYAKSCNLSYAAISLLDGDGEYKAAKVLQSTCNKGWAVRKFEIDCPTTSPMKAKTAAPSAAPITSAPTTAPTKAPTTAPTVMPLVFKPFTNVADPGMCLSLQNGFTEDGTKIWVYPCTAEEPAQQWVYDAEGRIRNKKDPTKCITSPAYISFAGSLVLETCSDKAEQVWTDTQGVGAIKRIDSKGRFGSVSVTKGYCGGALENQAHFLPDLDTHPTSQPPDGCVYHHSS